MDRKYSTITALHWINRAKSVCERLNVSSISCNAHKCPFGCGISKQKARFLSKNLHTQRKSLYFVKKCQKYDILA